MRLSITLCAGAIVMLAIGNVMNSHSSREAAKNFAEAVHLQNEMIAELREEHLWLRAWVKVHRHKTYHDETVHESTGPYRNTRAGGEESYGLGREDIKRLDERGGLKAEWSY